MKNKSLILIIILSLFSVSLPSCLKDLDRFPFYGLDSESLYADPENYVHVLAKLYAGLAISGNKGPAGAPDITGIDEGFSAYVRVLWNLQELPTDEAVCAWSDPGIPELHEMSWNSENSFTQAMYYRIFYQIPLCNEFIRESSDDKLSERGFSDADKATIRTYRAEARFLRALSYYHALDLFGNVPFVTEDDLPGSFFPNQISRTDLFNYVEGELLSIEGELIDAHQNEYARADKAADWCLLSRLYLNAEVYTGIPKYTEAVTYSNKVIEAGYSLEPSYPNLFLADNNNSNEIIFPVTFDGINTKTYGGTTFLVHAPVGGTMKPADFGINGGWAGYRTTKSLVFLFPDSVADSRYLFYTDGQNLEINDIKQFKDGYAVAKWKNLTSQGIHGSDATGNFVDTDFPMFRLAEVYLNYAEAVLRGGGGDVGTAVNYINELRTRAYGGSAGNVTSIDLDFILNERGRELQWEAVRRTDLVRYNRLTGGTYVWPWKGGVMEGTSVPDYLNLFPIPAADITANPNLVQNPGY